MYIRLLVILILVSFHCGVNARAIEKKFNTIVPFLSGYNSRVAVLPAIEESKRLQLPAGLKLSLNLSNTNFNKGYPKPANPVETAWLTGFSGGVFLEFPIFNNLSLQQEYLYTYLRSELKKEEIEYRLGYISLPI